MKKYEIIIKNLKTGEELIHEQTGCIIGAFASEKDSRPGTTSFAFHKCTGLETIMTIAGVEKIVKESKIRLAKSYYDSEGRV